MVWYSSRDWTKTKWNECLHHKQLISQNLQCHCHLDDHVHYFRIRHSCKLSCIGARNVLPNTLASCWTASFFTAAANQLQNFSRCRTKAWHDRCPSELSLVRHFRCSSRCSPPPNKTLIIMSPQNMVMECCALRWQTFCTNFRRAFHFSPNFSNVCQFTPIYETHKSL